MLDPSVEAQIKALQISEKDSLVAALKHERETHIADDDRVAEIDEQLTQLGAAPAKGKGGK